MKQLTLFLILASLAFGDEVPKAPERPLTKEESLTLQLSQSRILRLRDKYKIAEYEAEVQPLINDQQVAFVAACKSIGIPDAKIATECRLSTGVDGEGKPVTGPDGKPVAARVWWEKPEPSKVIPEEKK